MGEDDGNGVWIGTGSKSETDSERHQGGGVLEAWRSAEGGRGEGAAADGATGSQTEFGGVPGRPVDQCGDAEEGDVLLEKAMGEAI